MTRKRNLPIKTKSICTTLIRRCPINYLSNYCARASKDRSAQLKIPKSLQLSIPVMTTHIRSESSLPDSKNSSSTVSGATVVVRSSIFKFFLLRRYYAGGFIKSSTSRRTWPRNVGQEDVPASLYIIKEERHRWEISGASEAVRFL